MRVQSAVLSIAALFAFSAPARAQGVQPSPDPSPPRPSPTASVAPTLAPVPSATPAAAPSAGSGAAAAAAAAPQVSAPSVGSPPLFPYDGWTRDATRQSGLFTLWRKDGRVYLELRDDQLDKEYVQTGLPANGLGGPWVHAGDLYQNGARVLKFARDGRRVALLWLPTPFTAAPNTPLADAIAQSTAASVIGIASIVAENKPGHSVVVDLSAFLNDLLDITSSLNEGNERNPLAQYRFDPQRSYFGPSKAFPKNVIFEADQTFASVAGEIPTVTDPRSVQVKVTYNITEMPSGDYVPRYADDRVGIWNINLQSWAPTRGYDPFVRPVLRWNMQPSDPTKPLSPAKAPLVYTLSNTIPVEYRPIVRDGILQWNKAFEKIGISDAVRVQDQPSDPNFDPDDIRYNVIRWETNAIPTYGAAAQIVWNPRTGQIFQSGVLIDGSSMVAQFPGGLIVQHERGLGELPSEQEQDRAADMEMATSAGFGATVEALQSGGDFSTAAARLQREWLYYTAMHETGHCWGMAHNYMGHLAYSWNQVRNKAFTSRNSIVSSVMEYTPVNVQLDGTAPVDHYPTALGPYDYHTIRWAYMTVPNARTPEAELPMLRGLASEWTDPRYAFASDEDVAWNGHAVDPRIQHFLLTNDPLTWTRRYLGMINGLFPLLDRRFPEAGQPYNQQRVAFTYVTTRYDRYATAVARWIGGEYLSRARPGDPHATLPLTAVSLSDQKAAWSSLDHYVFSNDAFRFRPETLRRLVYTEYGSWSPLGYTPQPRHDISVAAVAGMAQNNVLTYLYSPLVLSRIADLPTKYGSKTTISLADLFGWTQTSIYGDVANGKVREATQVRRNLQRRYAKLLTTLAVTPPRGTPYDAQALARYELVALKGAVAKGTRTAGSDPLTQAHLAALADDVNHALDARPVLPLQ